MFPKDVLMSFKEKSNEVVSEMIEKTPKAKKYLKLMKNLEFL
jgi:hypothetical protein